MAQQIGEIVKQAEQRRVVIKKRKYHSSSLVIQNSLCYIFTPCYEYDTIVKDIIRMAQTIRRTKLKMDNDINRRLIHSHIENIALKMGLILSKSNLYERRVSLAGKYTYQRTPWEVEKIAHKINQYYEASKRKPTLGIKRTLLSYVAREFILANKIRNHGWMTSNKEK